LYSSADVVGVVMEASWAGHAEMKNTQRTAVLFCKPEGKKDIYGSVRIILNWILRKWNGRGWSGFIWLKTWTSSGL
jgi:hypothetical protein